MAKAFASQADLTEKKTSFEQLSKHCWAYTTEGDPNSGVIIGDRFIMVSDASDGVKARPCLTDWPHRIIPSPGDAQSRTEKCPSRPALRASDHE